MSFTAVAALMAALLPLRYPNQNPFVIIPATMLILVVSTLLYYLLRISILRFPTSRFSAVAKPLTFFFACAALASLVAALFPSRRSITFVYSIFSLLVVGRTLFVLGVFAAKDEADHVDADRVQADRTWYEGLATRFRRYKIKLASRVVGFFQEQTSQPTALPI